MAKKKKVAVDVGDLPGYPCKRCQCCGQDCMCLLWKEWFAREWNRIKKGFGIDEKKGAGK